MRIIEYKKFLDSKKEVAKKDQYSLSKIDKFIQEKQKIIEDAVIKEDLKSLLHGFEIDQKRDPNFDRFVRNEYRVVVYFKDDVCCFVDFILKRDDDNNYHKKLKAMEADIVEFIDNYSFEEEDDSIDISDYKYILDFVMKKDEDIVVFESFEFSEKLEDLNEVDIDIVFSLIEKIAIHYFEGDREEIKKVNDNIYYVDGQFKIYFAVGPEYIFLIDISKELLTPTLKVENSDNWILKHSKKSYPLDIFIDSQKDDWIEFIVKNSDGNIALSPEEENILKNILEEPNNRFPFFINGRAGSGKSTILQYLFAHYITEFVTHNDDKYPPLYLTYNESLKEKALEKVVNIILAKQHLKEKFPTTEREAITRTIENFFKSFDVEEGDSFLIELLKANGKENPFEGKKRIDFSQIQYFLQDKIVKNNSPKVRKLTPELVWYVIRSFIKGKAKIVDGQIDEFSLEDYLKLPEDEQTIQKESFEIIEEKIYPIYKKYLKDNNLYDDLDLVMEIFKQNSFDKKYSIIFCDEAQDFTKLEFDLILNLNIFLDDRVKVDNIQDIPIVFAGDPFQTLNPTGFSFKTLRADVYKSFENKTGKKIEPNDEELEYNYRSSKSIIKYSNTIQLSRTVLFDAKKGTKIKLQKSWFSNSERRVFFFDITNKNIKKFLKDENDKYDMILPLDIIKDQLYDGVLKDDTILNNIYSFQKKDYNTSIKVKGREFDIIVLYRFGDYFLDRFKFDDIENYLKNGFDNKEKQLPYEYYFNNLYVAVTRPRERLYIVDSEESYEKFWKKIDKIDELVERYKEITNKELEQYEKNGDERGERILLSLLDGSKEDLTLKKTRTLIVNRLKEFFDRYLESKDKIEQEDFLNEIDNILSKNKKLSKVYKRLYKGLKRDFEKEYLKSAKSILEAIALSEQTKELSQGFIKRVLKRVFNNLYHNLFEIDSCSFIKENRDRFRAVGYGIKIKTDIVLKWCNKEYEELLEFIIDENITKEPVLVKIILSILKSKQIDIDFIKELYHKGYLGDRELIELIRFYKDKNSDYVMKLFRINKNLPKEEKALFCQINLKLNPEDIDCLMFNSEYDKVISLIKNGAEIKDEYIRPLLFHIDKTGEFDILPFDKMLQNYDENMSVKLGKYLIDKGFEDRDKYISDIINMIRNFKNETEKKEQLVKHIVSKIQESENLNQKDSKLFEFFLDELSFDNKYIDICSKIEVLEKVINYKSSNLDKLLKFYHYMMRKNYYKHLIAVRYLVLSYRIKGEKITKIKKTLKNVGIDITERIPESTLRTLPLSLEEKICKHLKGLNSVMDIIQLIKKYQVERARNRKIESVTETMVEELDNNLENIVKEIDEVVEETEKESSQTDDKEEVEEEQKVEEQENKEENIENSNSNDEITFENLDSKLEQIFEFLEDNRDKFKNLPKKEQRNVSTLVRDIYDLVEGLRR